MTPIVTEHAAQDIHQLFEFHNEQIAQLIVNEIIRNIQDLDIFPLLGRSRDDLKQGLRSFVVKKYVVFYRIWQNTPVVVRVVHGSRDLEALFENEN
jgi:toxin ParE1/3/4